MSALRPRADEATCRQKWTRWVKKQLCRVIGTRSTRELASERPVDNPQVGRRLRLSMIACAPAAVGCRITNARATSSFSVIAQRAQKRVLIGISIDRRNIINPHRPGADRTGGPIHFQRCSKLLRSIIRHALPSLVLVTPSIRRFRWLLHPRTISNLPAPLRAAQAEELRYCIAAKP